VKDLALDLFLLRGALDDDVAIRQRVDARGWLDPAKRRLARVVGEPALGDEPLQIAIDGRERRLDTVLGDVVQQHVETGHCRHMRDAVAHLARADHPDFFDVHSHPFILAGCPTVPCPARS
jgi:hypothetical protein